MSEENQESYRTMLLELSYLIDNEDLQRMKFRCDQIVKKRQSEKVQTALDLFQALEERGKLGPSNTTFLKELLKTCCAGKVDGQRLLDTYERGGVPAPPIQSQTPFQGFPGQNPGVGSQVQPQVIYVVNNASGTTNGFPAGHHFNDMNQRYEGPDLNVEISFLCRSLGKDWKFYMRALGITDDDIENVCLDHQPIRERIHQCLLLWQRDRQQSANKLDLIRACRQSSVQREDLAVKLEEGRY